MTEDETRIYDALMSHAEERGQADGSWIIDGNTSADQCREILRMIDDGDPALDAIYPPTPLSGEYAGLSMAEIWLDATGEDEPGDGWPLYMADEYELAYWSAWEAEVSRACRYQLADD